MLALVQRFLGAETLDDGRLALHTSRFDLAALADHVVDRFRPAAARKDQALAVESRGPAWVDGDRDWLKEVVDNLISNAVKYTPAGRRIWVSVAQAEGRVQLRVRDEGPGLSADDQAKLFGRFQRLSAQPTGGESSTGLGLSIVKKVVEFHQGRVWAENALGEGTTFVVELDAPASESEPASARIEDALALA
ncbi:sensor histidine kinase [Rubrivirga sp.]|uniref:sensor histidine kinase n=1 Tax=Rubrivirga sp. TaxID=1885344 RepID=UPI003B522C15